jgi:LytS/YehU family sensor histidine kinase
MYWLRPKLRRTTWLMNWLTTALLGMLGASAGFVVPTLLLSAWSAGRIMPPEDLGLLLFFDMLLAIFLALLISGYVKLRNEIREAERARSVSELQARELAVSVARTRCAVLQSQIKPHFFFNTLNTLSALIKSDAMAASKLVDSLARLFRYSLGCSAEQLQPMDAELAFVQTYLEIEKVRFGDRLRVEWELSLKDRSLTLPGLTIQPLVENAVTHGVVPFAHGGTIRITAATDEQGAMIRVANRVPDGVKVDTETWFQPGHSLHIIQERLQLEYQRGGLRFESQGGWLTTIMEIPSPGGDRCGS